ncbi:MAG: hypothetical protein IKZ97_00435 [Butyrivibrio sp.]|nr:hypothetical protein [Butyrivibrio sp.]
MFFKEREDETTEQAGAVKPAKKRHTWPWMLVVAVMMIVLAFWPYIEVNSLTAKYGEQFSEGYLDPGYGGECDYFKVVRYKGKGPHVWCSGRLIPNHLTSVTDNEAVVIYVVNNHSAELLIIFDETGDGEWKMKEWSCVWSRSGSADDMTWPWYR